MHGHSEPLNQKTSASTNPITASGTHTAGGWTNTWATPNSAPEIAAAGHGPRQRVSAANRYPRNTISSTIGAVTATPRNSSTMTSASLPAIEVAPPGSDPVPTSSAHTAANPM